MALAGCTPVLDTAMTEPVAETAEDAVNSCSSGASVGLLGDRRMAFSGGRETLSVDARFEGWER